MHYYAIDLESFVFSGAPKYAGLTPGERKALDGGTIVRHVDQLLDMLGRHGVRLTFFVLGEIDEWYPDLAGRIRSAGHEIGYHTHGHAYLERPGLLGGEIAKSRAFLDRHFVRGFQAPAIVLHREDYAVLKAAGFAYSASVYSSAGPHTVDGVLEIPVSSRPWNKTTAAAVRYPARMTPGLLRRELPWGSSLFLKVLGWRRVSGFIRDLEREGKSANLFIHNWQLFPEPAAARRDRVRECFRNPLYLPYAFNAREEFVALLREHEFGPLGDAAPEAARATAGGEACGCT